MTVCLCLLQESMKCSKSLVAVLHNVYIGDICLLCLGLPACSIYHVCVISMHFISVVFCTQILCGITDGLYYKSILERIAMSLSILHASVIFIYNTYICRVYLFRVLLSLADNNLGRVKKRIYLIKYCIYMHLYFIL